MRQSLNRVLLRQLVQNTARQTATAPDCRGGGGRGCGWGTRGTCAATTSPYPA